MDYREMHRQLDKFMGMVYSACRMAMWCFNTRGKLYYSSCQSEKEFLTILKMSGCLDYALSPERKRDCPVYLGDDLGLVWIADYCAPDHLVFLLGPFFSSESSLQGIREAMSCHGLPVELSIKLLHALHGIPVINRDMQDHYAAMLHYTVTGEPLHSLSIEYQHPDSNAWRDEIFDSEVVEERLEAKLVFVSRSSQERIFRAIREGDSNVAAKLSQDEQTAPTMASITHYGAKHTGRDEKNENIMFAALCAHAAVEGGLSSQIAEQIRTRYVTGIERAKTVTELYNLSQSMTAEFIKWVKSVKKSDAILSQSIQNACEYIHQHIEEEIDLDEIARTVGYSKYYLTKKFQNETGLRVNEYIMEEKIALSKIWLLTTEMDIQEISDRLSFNSRNYFTKVFKKTVGVNPTFYRSRKEV